METGKYFLQKHESGEDSGSDTKTPKKSHKKKAKKEKAELQEDEVGSWNIIAPSQAKMRI